MKKSKKVDVLHLTKNDIAKAHKAITLADLTYHQIDGKQTEAINKAKLVYITTPEGIKILKNRNGAIGIVNQDGLDAEIGKVHKAHRDSGIEVLA